MILIQGKGVSNGVAVGPLYFYKRAESKIARYEIENAEEEWARFKTAQEKAIEELGELAEKAREEAGDEAALLFETHQMMAEDMEYEEAIQTAIQDTLLNAEAAVTDTAAQFAEMFAAMEDPYFQVLTADGSIDAPVTKAEIKRLEDNPRKSLKMYQDSAEKTSEKRASGAAKTEKKEKSSAAPVDDRENAEKNQGSNPE